MSSSPSPFVTVSNRPAVQPDAIDPRATRYGIMPIWPHETKSLAFAAWEFPPNQAFPMRPFPGEVIYDMHGNMLNSVTRLPADQIADCYTMSPYFIELKELTKLSEDDAAKVMSTLLNPGICSKYPSELGNDCTSCWIDYLRNDVARAIDANFGAALAKPLYDAAIATAATLLAGYEKALTESRRQIHQTIQDVDASDGKLQFQPQDLLNVYHTHAERPTYRTSTSANNDVGTQIVNALKAGQVPSAIDAEAIANAVSEGVRIATAELSAKLAEYEAKETLASVEPATEAASMTEVAEEKEETFGEKMKRIKAEKALAAVTE